MTTAPSTAPFATSARGLGQEGTSPDIGTQVQSEQLASLYDNTITPVTLGLVFSLFPLLLLWSYLPQASLLAWFGARCLTVGLRCLDVWRFRQQSAADRDNKYWRRRYLSLLALDALGWGAAGWLFHAPALPELDSVLLAAMVGLGAVGLFSRGHVFHANLIFSSLSFAPLSLYHLGQGTPTGAVAALGLLVFLAITLLESRRIEARTAALLRQRFAHAWVAEQRQQAWLNAEESSTSKSRFVAVMSHEIRTPLNGILGMTQLLERSNLDEQQREQVDIVRRSGRHLLALVNDILDLARIESGKLAVDAGPVNVREAVDEVCRLLAEVAREKQLGFELQLSPGLPPYALGDASRIKQVLHNLIGNAIKFTEQGRVSIDVSTVIDMRAGTLLRFAVRDTGEGISADQMERVFAPFEQAGSAERPRRQDGTGLGLTISRELARAMGGDLRCSSVPGQGSLFEFTLPLQVCAGIEAPAGTARADRVPQLAGRVLLVDDSAVNLLVAASMLERCGLQVEQAEHGLQALERLEATAYDLVLMDCQMPELDGFEATRRWRAHERRHGLAHVPIVALTASAVNGDRERCIRCGMDDYLVKPFEMDDLVAVVQRHLQVPALA